MATLRPAVKIPALWLVVVCFFIIGVGIWLARSAVTEAQVAIAFLLFSLVAAIVTFGMLGATGMVHTRRYQFGGSAAIFLVTFLILLNTHDESVSIIGTVYMDNQPIKRAVIRILNTDIGDREHEIKESDLGAFKFSGIRLSGRQLDFQISVPGYHDTTTSSVYAPANRVFIKLSRTNLHRIPEINSLKVESTKIRQTAYGFATPPALAASIVAGAQRPPFAARFGKVRLAKDDGQLPLLSDGEITMEQHTHGDWMAVIDTKKSIEKQFPNSPHGVYRAIVSLVNTGAQLRDAKLNYVYDFITAGAALEANPSHFRVYPGKEIEIQNQTKTKTNFVSARLKQDFDFNTDFVVRGAFLLATLGRGSGSAPALDISFGDRWGDLVSVIIGEDGGDSYSIKVRSEPIRKNGLKDTVNKIDATGVHVIRDGKTPNYFEIRMTRTDDPRWTLCRLFISRLQTEQVRHLPVFERCIDSSLLAAEVTKIRLKLWQLGNARIYDLEVAELPPSSQYL